jgi:aminopeptidase
MQNPILKKWAALLCDYCLEIKAGQSLMIYTSTESLPLVREIHNALLMRDAFPILNLGYPEQNADFFAHANDTLLDSVSRAEIAQMQNIDAFLSIRASSNNAALSSVDPEKQTRVLRASKELRQAREGKPWCVTLYPTQAYAQDAGMSLSQLEQFVFGTMFLDTSDPVAAWGEIHALQAELIKKLEKAKIVKLEANGTDLTLEVTNRIWRNSDGRRNMPSGEVFTGPLETSANGKVFFTIPSMVNGVEVSNVKLEFKNGKVIAASAEKGDAYLQRALETDEGSRFLGELGIGTNFGIQRAIKSILFDEKIGGTVHLALGNSYPETLGTNQSALHWDLILDMRPPAGGGRVLLDGNVFAENGKFV